jgi:hypothetical protein
MDSFTNWITLAKTGLILNTLGSIVLIMGSNKVMDVLSKFIDTVGPTYGTYGQGNVAPQIKDLSKSFYNVKRAATLYNLIGYILFIAGFILQLV